VTSRAQTRSTRPTAGDNVGTAAARTAGRGRDEAQSLAVTVRHRRPSDQLTPSQCPQLDGDALERQHVSPFTDNSSRHSISSGTHTVCTHTDAARQLARPATQTHTRTHSPTTSSTTTGLLSFTHSAQLLELNSNYTVSRLHDRLTVY